MQRDKNLQLRVRPVAALLTGLLLLSACGDSGENEPAGRPGIVATTTVLGDVVRNVAGSDATVTVLLPIGADPHDYQPSASQAAELQRADLVIANGLSLEEGLTDVLTNARADGANVLELAPRLDPLPFGEGGDSADPHVWLDPLRMAEASRLVALELSSIDSTVDWVSRADVYAAELLAADGQVRQILAAVPEARRKLVTNHDSLGYFADRYGFEVVGTIIPGGATLAEPSSGDLAELVSVIDAEGVRAIFAESTDPVALAEAVAAEADFDVGVVELFTGSLGGPGSGAETLIDLLLTNARRIADALS